MELRLSWIGPLREKGNGILGLALRKSSFGDPNPTRSSSIVLDNYRAERGYRPIRMLYKDADRIVTELAQEGRFPIIMVTIREGRGIANRWPRQSRGPETAKPSGVSESHWYIRSFDNEAAGSDFDGPAAKPDIQPPMDWTWSGLFGAC